MRQPQALARARRVFVSDRILGLDITCIPPHSSTVFTSCGLLPVLDLEAASVKERPPRRILAAGEWRRRVAEGRAAARLSPAKSERLPECEQYSSRHDALVLGFVPPRPCLLFPRKTCTRLLHRPSTAGRSLLPLHALFLGVACRLVDPDGDLRQTEAAQSDPGFPSTHRSSTARLRLRQCARTETYTLGGDSTRGHRVVQIS